MAADSPPKLKRPAKFSSKIASGISNESNVATKLEVVISGNEIDVVGELVSRLRAKHGREEFATDEGRAGNIESNGIAVLRFERRATFAKVEPRFVYDVVRKRRGQRGDRRKVSQRLNACSRKIILAQRLVL